MTGKLCLVFLLVWPALSFAQTSTLRCRFTWDQVTRATNGQPITIAGYKLYKGSTTATSTLAKTIPLRILQQPKCPGWVGIACTRGQYWAVTAYDAQGRESGKSAVFRVP